MAKKIFPAEIENILLLNLQNPAASSCADVHLTRALRKYDNKKETILFVEELTDGTHFKIKGGKNF